ncbi:sugar-transfer associated ATP-grasp domain-containing protein [Pontibacter roseus]|uniref:sugar-transfer associated ATP-grasp domain-containing protein n=1 Tax=Pontibacter roseus TaxID=336989 RepID=UPI00035F2CBB|nr:sugar-transfer associated ATP-grasp domain-containing protein [Pontibacter roseus]
MKLKLTRFSYTDFIKRNVFNHSIRRINIFKLFYLWSKGFDTKNIILYKLNFSNWCNYLPDSIRYKITLNTNQNYWPILHDKFLFYSFINDKLPTPELFGIIHQGSIFGVKENYNYEIFLKQIFSKTKLVLKPLQGGKGQGILFIDFDGENILVQNEILSEGSLHNQIKSLSEYGIFKYYEQHKELSKIFPLTINTIRLVTFVDENTRPSIFAGVLRVGWSGSIPFDNFSQGGMVSLIDCETGKLSPWLSRASNGMLLQGNLHPDSKASFESIILPHWNQIKDEMLAFLAKYPIFEYVGWDILVTDYGFVIIEGNHNPDLDLIQVHKPYLTDKRAKKFFKSKNII